ncbi:hypothetical protein [Oceanospirillum sediminis]|uniref:Uncharacterized protein n=1 Tax=Oceanospirillum sediminis TaxID=2760088 RepID=A0A839IWD1_9GAMM|nr:hypothetical protein [Oceanospirillum sediminis]MBB1489072.1 hypothetical protein [Oceanospirillum sediminis]
MTQGVYIANARNKVEINNAPRQRGSLLGRLIEIIALDGDSDADLNRSPFDIDEKITFNDLNNHDWLFDLYVDHYNLIDDTVSEFNRSYNKGGEKLKKQMKTFYQKALSEFNIKTRPFDIDRLKEFSDEIVTSVIQQTLNMVKMSGNLQDGYYIEELEQGVYEIVSYCIIECVVLENPR